MLRQGNKDRISLNTPRFARCRLEELQAALREAETYIVEDVVARDAELEAARAEAAAARVCSWHSTDLRAGACAAASDLSHLEAQCMC